MDNITPAMKILLSRAKDEGIQGFSAEAIRATNTNNPTIIKAWSDIVSGDYVAPKMYATPETPLVITPKGQEALRL